MRGDVWLASLELEVFYNTKGGKTKAPKKMSLDMKYRGIVSTDGRESVAGIMGCKPGLAKLKMRIRVMMTPAKAARFLDIRVKTAKFITHLGQTMYDIDDPKQMKYLKSI